MIQAPYVLLAILTAAAVVGLLLRLRRFLHVLAASRPQETKRP